MIPKDAREVYLNEQGEPIAYCPKDSLGLTDLARGEFCYQNADRLRELLARARVKSAAEGREYAVVCIDVNDPTWTWLVDLLMPGHDWDAYRQRGERPVARGVVPRDLLVDTGTECYPAALPAPAGPFIATLAAGGILLTKE